MVPTGFVQQSQIEAEISKAKRKLGPEVVRVNYSIGSNSTDDPSIFFRVVLTDDAAKEDRLAEGTRKVGIALFDELRPIENWGLIPYVNFRSQTEQNAIDDPDWK
jgi:hypothetical protein